MDADRRNDTGIFRYTDVEYTPEGHTDAYRWDDFLGIAGGHVYSAMDTIDMVSTGGQYEGDEPEHAYACEIVGYYRSIAVTGPVPCLRFQPKGLRHESLHARGTRPLRPGLLPLR